MDGFADRFPLPPPPLDERPPCPVPLAADVAALIMPEAYPSPRAGTMIAGLLAAAACARVGLLHASQIRIGQHWSRERPARLLVPDRRVPRPAHLLPIVQLAFRRICEACDRKEGDLLFADGEPTGRNETLHYICTGIGKRMGINTRSIILRMHDFYDTAIPVGTSDEMIFALSGPKLGRPTLDAPRYEVPLPKLRSFLDTNHPLAGAASNYTGEKGREWISSQPRNLPEPRSHRWKEVSPAFHNDPVVLLLRAVKWPKSEKKWKKFRLGLRNAHFPHIHSLLTDKKLRPREVVELFRSNKHMIGGWRSVRVVTDPIERPRREWKRILVAAYADRRPDETTNALWRRIVMAERCPVNSATVRAWWIKAGLLKRRRGRPRKKLLLRPRRKAK